MTITSEQRYAGNCILEAMRSSPGYGEAIFAELHSTIAEDASRSHTFRSGAGFFVERFHSIGVAVEAVETDVNLPPPVRSLATTVSQ
jgi:hypothetical protein